MRFLPAFALISLILLSPGFAGEDSVVFNQTKFFLRFAPKNSKVGLREYLPEGQTLEKWTQMLSSRIFTNLNDPGAYAHDLAKRVKNSDPNANSQILRSDKTGALVVDFLVFSPMGTEPPFAEWNLMRVDKLPKGLRVVQYARRFYEIDESAASQINAARPRVLAQLEKLTLPE